MNRDRKFDTVLKWRGQEENGFDRFCALKVCEVSIEVRT